MDVRLPNGKLIKNVPDGTTQDELVSTLADNGHNISWAEQAGWLPSIGAGLVRGGGKMAQGGLNLAGGLAGQMPDNSPGLQGVPGYQSNQERAASYLATADKLKAAIPKYQPEGYQSLPKQLVGGAFEAAPAVGNLPLYGLATGMNKAREASDQGMDTGSAVAKAMGTTGLDMAMLGGKIPVGKLATQPGVIKKALELIKAGGAGGAKMAALGGTSDLVDKVTTLNDPNLSDEEKKRLTKDIKPTDLKARAADVFAGTIASILGTGVGSLPAIKKALRGKFEDWKSEQAAEIKARKEGMPAAPPIPAQGKTQADPGMPPAQPAAPVTPKAALPVEMGKALEAIRGKAAIPEMATAADKAAAVPKVEPVAAVPSPVSPQAPDPNRYTKQAEAVPAVDVAAALQKKVSKRTPEEKRAIQQAETEAWEAEMGIKADADDWLGIKPGTEPPPVHTPKKSEATPIAAPKINAEAKLPEHMGASRERKGPDHLYGEHPLTFEHDIDRAAYFLDKPAQDDRVAKGEISPAEAAGEYLKFVMDNTGMTEAEARDHGNRVHQDVIAAHERIKAAGIATGLPGRWNRTHIHIDDRLGASKAAPAEPPPKPAPAAKSVEDVNAELAALDADAREKRARESAAEVVAKEKERAAAARKAEEMRAAPHVEKEFAERKATLKKKEAAILERMASGNANAEDYRGLEDTQKSLKGLGFRLSAARRAATGKLTIKEREAARPKLASQIRKRGIHTNLRDEISPGHPTSDRLFRSSGMQIEDIMTLLKEEGWFHGDEADIETAKQMVRDELANPGSTMHPLHGDDYQRAEELERLKHEMGMPDASEAEIDRELARVAEEAHVKEVNSFIDDLRDHLGTIMNEPVTKHIAAAAIVGGAAGEAAASDGKGGDGAISTALTVAALGVGGRVMWVGGREMLKGGAHSPLQRMADDMFELFFHDTKNPETVRRLAEVRDGRAAEIRLGIHQVLSWAKDNVPKDASLTDWIRSGPGAHQPFFDVLKEAFSASADPIDKLKWHAPEPGVDREFAPRVGIMTSVWKDTPKLREWLDAYHENTDKNKDFPLFHFEEGLDGIEAGLKEGLELVSDDPFKVWGNFAKEAAGALTQGQMIKDLRKATLPNGKAALVPMKGTTPPDGYTRIGDTWGGNLPDLNGYAVHDDLVPSMKLSFDTWDKKGTLGAVARGVIAFTGAIKRINVFGSTFHVATLGQAGINNAIASGDIGVLNIRKGLRYLEGTETYTLPDGRDAMRALVGEGLRVVDAPLEGALGNEETHKLEEFLGNFTDKVFGGVKVGTYGMKGVRKVDDEITRITWQVTHAGIKAETAMIQLDKAIANQKNSGKDLTTILREVAEYTNDQYGGIDWRRIGEGADSKIGKFLASNLFTGPGRAAMDATLFAPDWLFSTSRAWIKAAKPDIKKVGWNKWDEQNARYAKQLVSGMAATMALAEGIQYAFTGKSAWDNEPKEKNPTWVSKVLAKMEVRFEDGTKMNVGKHYTDFLRLFDDPAQEALYKLSAPVSEGIAQVQNSQWPVAGKPKVAGGHGAPPMTYRTGLASVPDRAAHALGRATPFFSQSATTPGAKFWSKETLEKAASAMAGLPIHGVSKDDRQAAREYERERKRQAEE